MAKKKEKQPMEAAEDTIVQEADAQNIESDNKKTDTPETYTLTAEEFEQAKTHIETLQKERDDTVALLQRIQADFDNYRRRNASIRADSYEEGTRDAIKALLPVIDNFDRAFASEANVDESWRTGIVMVHKQLMEILSKQGLSEIEATGKFDPTMHEAVMQEKVDGAEQGDILMVLQKGYRVGEKIIRHAMVKVAE